MIINYFQPLWTGTGAFIVHLCSFSEPSFLLSLSQLPCGAASACLPGKSEHVWTLWMRCRRWQSRWGSGMSVGRGLRGLLPLLAPALRTTDWTWTFILTAAAASSSCSGSDRKRWSRSSSCGSAAMIASLTPHWTAFLIWSTWNPWCLKVNSWAHPTFLGSDFLLILLSTSARQTALGSVLLQCPLAQLWLSLAQSWMQISTRYSF